MKKTALTMAVLMLTALAGCGSSTSSGIAGAKNESNTGESTASDSVQKAETDVPDHRNADSGTDTLVVYFSRTGENYGVGVIDKGNTAIVADMIVDETGADKFEIVPVNPYPESYDETLMIARQEASENALPEYQGEEENWTDYDTVFIGYPIWNGDMPRIVYTFLQNHDWSGKTVIPFDTNGGSGLSGTESTIADKTGANVLGGLAVRGTDAQKNQDSVREDVKSWLERLGL